MSHPPKEIAKVQKHSDNWSNSGGGPVLEKTVAEKLALVMKNQGDVTFIVGEEKKEIKACSKILSALSSVFEAMFNGQWKEKSKIIPIPDVDPKIFDIFLNLIVTNELAKRHILYFLLPVEEVLRLLYIAKKYDVKPIENCCREIIKSSMTIQNAVSIFEALEFADEVPLQQEILNFIEANVVAFFQTEEFLSTSQLFLAKVLKSDQLRMEEIDIFRAMKRWAEAALAEKGVEFRGKNVRECLGDLFSLIRFPLISSQHLINDVRPTGILKDAEYTGLLENNALVWSKASQLKLKEMHFNTTRRRPLRSPEPTRWDDYNEDDDRLGWN